ncbi:MAG TPA: O-antigen ligase family protein [Gemmataceae bacterium]|nr:O-antigen ligase family protein [Gemmataceae bacterium]
MLRRVLLGLVTALIVVRALVPGEDVGLLEPGANPMGLAVPLLWLCGLATWAAWRIWSGQLDWYGGLVDAGLLVVVLFSFLGTVAVASYQHPAWVVSWEWAGLLAAFFLVRQLARSPSDQRGLLAVLLATGVSLAAQAVYQHARPDPGRAPLPGLTGDELPRRRCEVLAVLGNTPQNPFPATLSLPALCAATSTSDPTLFERIAVKNNVRPETGGPALPLPLRPPPPRPPAATFTDESNLAGCLALLLPALAGCVLAAWLGGAPRWQLGVAVGCALLTALALWLTQDRSSILPCLLVGAAASLLAWRYYSSSPAGSAGPSPRLLLALALAGAAGLLLLAFLLRQRGGAALADLTREWSAASAMIGDHFWFGVGPGNYGRHYPQYMAATAPAFARQPDNFALEVWATLGLPAFLALAVALVTFFRRTLSFVPSGAAALVGDENPSGSPQPATADEDEAPRWEFYEGGMIGLLAGFLFRALSASPDAIIEEAVAAGTRAFVWFAVFALVQGIRWSGATRVLACTAGLAALLLHLAVAGGFSVPGVAQPLWIMAALALNGLPESPLSFGRQYLGRVLPLALACAAALFFILQLFQPLTAGASRNRSALATAQKYLDVRSGVFPSREDGKPEHIGNVAEALKHIISDPDRETGLYLAVQADPGNARYYVDAANWYGNFYDASPLTRDSEGQSNYLRGALGYARDAQKLDPRGEAGYLAEARALHLVALRDPNPAARAKAAGEEPQPLLKSIAYRPNDAQLHYRLAVALYGADQGLRAKDHAERALKLDAPALPPGRRLTEAQRLHAKLIVTGRAPRRPLP